MPSPSEEVVSIPQHAAARPSDEPIRGRGALLDAIEGLMAARDRRTVVLHGGGGYGKSTVALATARSAARRGRTVLWVGGHDRVRLETGMRDAVMRLLPTRDAFDGEWNADKPASSFWQVLEAAEQDWLLILDNVDDPSALEAEGARRTDGPWLRPFETTRGFVVVTSRAAAAEEWTPHESFEVGPLGPDDAAQVLLDFVAEAAESSTAVERARELGARLAGFPLALSIAGAHLRHASLHRIELVAGTEGTTLEDYLTALDERLAAAGADPSPEARLIGATSELSLRLLESHAAGRDDPATARALLRLLACMADAPIPAASFRLPADRPALFGEATDQQVDGTIAVLTAMGLVEPFTDSAEHTRVVDAAGAPDTDTDRAFTLHDLVREASRTAPDYLDDLESYAVALVGVVERATAGLRTEERADWPSWRMWAPHVMRSLQLCLQEARLPVEHPAVERAAAVAWRAAWYAHRAGLHRQAQADMRTIVDVHTRLHGPDAERTVESMIDLARVTRDAGDWEEAEGLLRRVAAHQEARAPGSDELIRTQNRLAAVLRLRGDFPAARELFRRVIVQQEAKLGGTQEGRRFLDLLSTRHNLALALRGEDEAEQQFKEVLRHRIRLLGPHHHETLQTRNQLAVLLRDKLHLEEAIEEFRAVETGRITAFGSPRHRDVLSTRNQLAGAHYRNKEYERAESIWRDVLAIRRSVLGPSHPYTLVVMQHLARAELEKGIREPDRKAEHLARAKADLDALESLQIAKYGQANDQVFGTWVLQGRVEHEAGRYDEAIALFTSALAGQEKMLGPGHIWTIETVFRRGLSEHAAGYHDEAVTDLRRVVRERRKRFDPGSSAIEEAEYALDQALAAAEDDEDD